MHTNSLIGLRARTVARALAAAMPSMRMPMIAAALLIAAARVPAQNRALIDQLRVYSYGADARVLDDVATWINASREAPAQRRQAAAALQTLLTGPATFEARTCACRWLAEIGGAEQVAALAGLLPDAKVAHYALMALARIPGLEADAALALSVPKVGGATRDEILTVMGERGTALHEPMLLRILAAGDRSSATAAAALARMPVAKGDVGRAVRICTALAAAYRRSAVVQRAPMADALLASAERADSVGAPAAAVAAYRVLDTAPTTPILRAAALRGLAQVRGVEAIGDVLAALAEDGTPRQNMAAVLARSLPGSATTGRLATGMSRLTRRGRALLIEAFVCRRERSPAVAAALEMSCRDSVTRCAALRALGGLGDAVDVPLLLEYASTGKPAERDAARTSLRVLRGPGIDAKVLAVANDASSPRRISAMQALGDRRASAAIPVLLACARRGTPQERPAALRILRDIGRAADMPALVDILLEAPAGSRDEVAAAVSEIGRRGADEFARTAAVLARLATVTAPADRADLLVLLGEIGGPRALEALRLAAADPQVDVRLAAIGQLAEWPGSEAMPDLLQRVRAGDDPRVHALALRGYIRMIGADERRTAGQAMALYHDISELAKGAAERKLVISGVAQVRSLDALQFASAALDDPEVRAEAEAAVMQIGRGTIGAYPDETRAALDRLAAAATDADVRKKVEEVLALPAQAVGYDLAWEASPAYTQDKAGAAALMDVPFPPEQVGGRGVPWRIVPVVTDPKMPWLLDLLALLGGEQRVAYIRSAVWTEKARELVLVLGSDDGARIWWNGAVVFTVNTPRGITPGQNRVTVQAKAGWNLVLIKINQFNMGWGACVSFVDTDGKPAAGLRYAVPTGNVDH